MTDLAYQHPLVDVTGASADDLSLGGEFTSAFFGNDEDFKPAGRCSVDCSFEMPL